MEIPSKQVSDASQKRFAEELIDPITLIHFTQEPSHLILPDHLKGQECMFCKETKALLKDVCSLSEKLSLALYDFPEFHPDMNTPTSSKPSLMLPRDPRALKQKPKKL